MRVDPLPTWAPVSVNMSGEWFRRRNQRPFKWRRFQKALRRLTCVVIDLETTGTDPVRHAPIKMGAISVHRGKIVDSLEYGIKPHDGAEISQSALDVNGWAGPMDDDLTPSVAFLALKDLFKRHPSNRGKIRVCGHNVAFDVGFMREMARRLDLSWDDYASDSRVHWRAIDTAHIAMVPYLYGDIGRTGLDGMCEELGLWHELKREDMGHRSPLADCAATLAVLYEMMWRYA